MELKTKKLIAREFLILVSIVLLSGFAYPLTYLNNLIVNFKVDSINKEIQVFTINNDELNKKIQEKIQNQNWICDKLLNKFGWYLSNFNNRELLWPTLTTIPLGQTWNTVDWDKSVIDYLISENWSPITFKDFIDRNCLSYEDRMFIKLQSENALKIKDLEIKKIYNNSYLINNNRTTYIYYTFIILFFVCFLFRYLFYSICWSIKLLRE